MDKQLEFSFDDNEIKEASYANSFYDYCISNDKLTLLDEWDYEKNDIDPKEIDYDSTKKVFWKCKKCDFNFELSVNARTNFYNSGCPLCANKIVVKGVNDLETLYPEITKKWDYTKNGDKKPYMYSPESIEKFCFICKKGHSFNTSINKLVKNIDYCPTCAKKKIIKGINDIFTLYPKLKKEWDNDKNTLDPYKLSPKSRKKVWLICHNGHSYETTIPNRLSHYRVCPYCLNLKPIVGKTDLATLRPDLISEYDTNNKIKLEELMINSTNRVNWVCKYCNNTYKMSVSAKVKGKKCPICKNKGVK